MDLLFFVGRKIEYMMHSKFLLDRLFSLVQTSEWDPKAERERDRKEERKRERKASREGSEARRKAEDSRATCERDG
jgi:hypothetical protein